jgi:hypothetical protein
VSAYAGDATAQSVSLVRLQAVTERFAKGSEVGEVTDGDGQRKGEKRKWKEREKERAM